MAEKVIGILGGMGPEATIDLYSKILLATPAARDQDHLHVIIDSNPKIPDRTAALLYGGADPTALLCETARNLERAGADFLVMPCNSAHLFYDRIAQAVAIPVLHIVDETVAEVIRRYPAVKTVGVLAADGATRLRLYHDRLEARGFAVISPDPVDQDLLQAAISRIKVGDKGTEVRDTVRAIAEHLVGRGAELLVSACTELPLVLRDGDVTVPVLDPTACLAYAAVQSARSPIG